MKVRTTPFATLFIVMLSLVLATCLTATTAQADSDGAPALTTDSATPGLRADPAIPYVIRDWDGSQVTEHTEYLYSGMYSYISSSTEALGEWNVVSGQVDNDNRPYVPSGSTARIVLTDGAKLYCEDGIKVPSGSALIIYCQAGGTGELYCDADTNDNAAIGADNEDGDCGTVVIHGGNITADTEKYGTNAAGIGGGDEGNGGTVVIFGGTVKAIGGQYGAGIGGGDRDYGRGGNGGNTYIYGGNVEATGGENGAGIGGGESGNGGTIKIYGGTVKAYGGEDGAGIGGGDHYNADGGDGGEISIYGGVVYAKGGDCAAAIGGGQYGSSGTILIDSTGTVTAECTTPHAGQSDGGAGIGGGNEGGVDSITIKNGKVTASGGWDGAGIGGGDCKSGGAITIEGGDVTATSKACGAGIGGGESGYGGTITISGGTVTATGGKQGAGIGCGRLSEDTVNESNNIITISGGKIKATGGADGAGIGGGHVGSGGKITINGGEIEAYGNSSSAGIGGGYKATGGTITINRGTITATGGSHSGQREVPYGGAGIGGGLGCDGGTITINGGTVTATGGYACAGIGGAKHHQSGTIVINGGNIEARGDKGGAGIGSGAEYTEGGSNINVTINGGTIKAVGGAKYQYQAEYSYANVIATGAAIGAGGRRLVPENNSGDDSVFEGSINLNGGTIDASYEGNNDYGVAVIGGYSLRGTANITVKADCTVYVRHASGTDSGKRLLKGSAVTLQDSNGKSSKVYNLDDPSDIAPAAERVNWCKREDTALQIVITPCDHPDGEYEAVDDSKHSVTCTHCTASDANRTKYHVWGDGVWGDVEYTWKDDNSEVTATHTCTKCDHEVSRTVRPTAWPTPATCEEEGNILYVAMFLDGDFPATSKTVPIPALGHDWGAPTYEWAADNSSVTATRVCAHDASHPETETVETTSEATKEATCEEKGETTYTAAFENEAFAIQTKTVEDIDSLGHDWEFIDFTWIGSEAEGYTAAVANYTCTHDAEHTNTAEAAIAEDVTEPTCAEPGKTTYTATVAATDSLDGAEHTDTKDAKSTDVLAHDWGEPTYEWAADNSSVTATRICEHDADHVETETVETTSEVTKEATCEEKGETTYTAEFENEAFAVQTKTVENVEALGHDWQFDGFDWQRPGESVHRDGIYATYSCKNDPAHTFREHNSLVITVSRIEPTCEKDGGGMFTAEIAASDSKDGQYHKGEKEVLEPGTATGHTEVVDEAEPATCTKTGLTEGKHCSVCNKTLVEQETVPATGHDWGAPSYEWADDNSTVTAKRVCGHDADHVETETAEVTSELTKSATCEGRGETTYTAEFANEAFATQTKTVDNIDALGHDWADWEEITAPTCTEKGQEARVCKHDASHKETRDIEALGHDWGEWVVTKEPTETEEGEETRTCARCGETETRPVDKLEPAPTPDPDPKPDPTPSGISYRNTEGNGNTWTKGSNTTSDFVFKRSENDNETFAHFVGIQVDGKDVDASNYTAEAGSVIVKLKPTYLETLALGKHTITALFADGNSASANFIIVAKKVTPSPTPSPTSKASSGTTPTRQTTPSVAGKTSNTGDSAPLAPLCVLALLAAAATIGARTKLAAAPVRGKHARRS